MTLTIIVWTHNRADLLDQTLKTMLAYTDAGKHKVIVQANGCDAQMLQNVAAITKQHGVTSRVFDNNMPEPGLKTLLEDINADCFCYCHDDVGFVPGSNKFWENMLYPMQDEAVACVGPTLNNGDGYQSYLRTEAPTYVKVHNIHYPMSLWRKSAFLGVGGHELDFGNGIDVDLSIRAHLGGYDLVVARNVYVNHVGGATWTKRENGADMRTWLYGLVEEMEHNIIRKHGVRIYADYVGRCREMKQVLTVSGYSHEATVKALSREPDEWVLSNREMAA